ncbi:hypothetical protein BGW39_004601 [Mortierella sp. 14UC]|nr:hypothetical protein BGW39_004601 [Mortierella sp. 14UC]
MNRHRVVREWVWDSDRKDLIKLEKHLAKLAGAGRVRLHYGWGSCEDPKEAIGKSLAASQDQFDKRQLKRDRAQHASGNVGGDSGRSILLSFGRVSRHKTGEMRWLPLLDSSLVELELRGAEVYEALPGLLPSLRYLTRFHFGTTYGCYVELDKILDACPLLEYLPSEDIELVPLLCIRRGATDGYGTTGNRIKHMSELAGVDLLEP